MEEEKSYQEIRKDLFEKYKTEILPKLSKYETIREDKQTSFNKLTPKKLGQKIGLIFACEIIFLILIFIILSVICVSLPPSEQQVFMNKVFSKIFILLWVMGFITFIVFYVSYSADLYRNIPYIKAKIDYKNDSKDFQKNIKSLIMPIVCGCFPNLKWVPYRNHPTQTYIDLNLLPKQYPKIMLSYGNYIEYDDCFEGKYKGIEYVIEEVEAVIYDKGINCHLFDGIIIQFKINKNFKGHTVIVPDKTYLVNNPHKLHRTDLEDVVFEKKYDVYTNDEVEARYLITPTFMNRLRDIKLIFNAKDIQVVFYQGVLYLALNIQEDLFNYGSIINSLKDIKPFIKMSEELISILKLLDYFKLGQNIGM